MVNRNKTIDLKKYGVIQDLNEGKDKGFSKRLSSQINKIKQEGKAREEKFREEYPKRVLSKAERRTITSQKEYERYKKELQNLNSYDSKKGNWKTKAYSAGSKIETRFNVALENVTQKLGRKLNERIISRKILKPNKMEVTIPNREIASHWNEENRFFKGKFEQERDMFFK